MLKTLEKKWKINKALPERFFKEHKNISRIFLQLLFNRTVFSIKDSRKKREEKIRNFLYPSYEDLFDPVGIKDLTKATKRIQQAIKHKEPIAIFGDYDADGVTASSVVYEMFNFFGIKPLVYIPHREKEGYGLNSEAIKRIASKKIKLLVTVDCGIRNFKEIEEANKLGIDVIITDHHEPSSRIPKAFAVINPKRKDCKYQFDQLAGVGVAFKLAQGVIRLFQSKDKGEVFLKWLLDLVAIGTIADCVPLIGENRILAKFGLIVFSKTRRIGIIELKRRAKNGNGSDLDFFIIPRINAVGRLDHADLAFLLLTTQSKIEAFKIVNRVEDLNIKRREVTDRILKEAREEIESFLDDKNIIILANKDWPSSVLGIVAGRLAEEYERPVLIVEKGIEFSKGSGRSYKGFDINESLQSMSHLFEKVGGHKQAVGFTYRTKNHEIIKSQLIENTDNVIVGSIEDFYEIDVEIKPEEISPLFYKELQNFAPFGKSNPTPTFLMEKVNITSKRLVGSNNHLKMNLEKNNKKFEGIAFGKGEWDNNLQEGDKVDIIFKIEENKFFGFSSIQLRILDLNLSNG